MRRTERFTIREDEATAEYGWIHSRIEDNAPEGQALGGWTARTLAHDVVEHMGSDEIGTTSDEMRALGCVYFTRVETGVLYDAFGKPVLSGDIMNVLQADVFNGDMTYMHTSEHWNDVDRYTRADWLRMARAGVAQWLSEWGYDDEDSAPKPSELVAMARSTAHYLCDGYAAAQRMYGDSHRAYSLFALIEDQLEKHCKNIDEERQGEWLHVTVNGAQLISIVHYEAWEVDENGDEVDNPDRDCDDCGEPEIAHGDYYENSRGYIQCYQCIANERVRDMERSELVETLESVYSVACYDEESTDELREALAENMHEEIREELAA